MKHNLSRFSGLPTRETLRSMMSELDKVFNEISNDVLDVLPKFFSPKVNIYKKDNDYVLDFFVPYTKKEDIDIQIEDDILSVFVKSTQDETIADNQYIIREISRGQATRKIYLGEGINQESLEANLKDGILSITFKPKVTPKSKSIKIEVK